jgi:hypothetical protein
MKIGTNVAGCIKRAISLGCEVIAFERSNEVGGIWLHVNDVGKDKYGNEIHSRMYEIFVSNRNS